MKNKRTIILTSIILGVLVLLFGITYSFFTFNKEGVRNSELVAGDVYMHYTESNNLTLTDAMPSNTYDPNKYFEFTIDGKNTVPDKDIWYEIVLSHGDNHNTRTERIKDNLLKFRLVNVTDNSILLDDVSYNSLTATSIYVDKILKNTNSYNKVYRLYVWISDSTKICGDNTEDDCDYYLNTNPTWNSVYASIKISVNGDFNEKTASSPNVEPKGLAKNIIDNYQLGTTEGLVAIDTNGELVTNASQTIREYRYSGNTVDNYVRFNNTGLAEADKNWRIIGVFKEDQKDNTGNWIVKLTRETPLDSSELTNVPGGISTIYASMGAAYWNTTKTGLTYNDWSTATLQKYLNSASEYPNDYYLGRLNSISEKIKTNANYYMGEVTSGCAVKNCYNQERKTGTVSWSDNNGLGHNMIWQGAIGLMYASDYLYAGANSNWGASSNNTSVKNNNWIWNMDSKIQANPSGNSNMYWFISPLVEHGDLAMHLNNNGNVDYTYVDGDQLAVRPVLNLESSVSVTNGTGTSVDKYIIE